MHRAVVAILLVSTGCRGLLGIDDDVSLRDATAGIDDGTADGPHDAPVVENDGPPADVAPIASCPVGYTNVGASATQYRFVSTKLPWMTAVADCADDAQFGSSQRTHLVVFGSDAERTEIQAQLPAEQLWIGLSKGSGDLRWVTDEPAPIPDSGDPAWATGEPDGQAQPCVFVDNGEYTDDGCGKTLAYVCECDGFPNDPTNY